MWERAFNATMRFSRRYLRWICSAMAVTIQQQSDTYTDLWNWLYGLDGGRGIQGNSKYNKLTVYNGFRDCVSEFWGNMFLASYTCHSIQFVLQFNLLGDSIIVRVCYISVISLYIVRFRYIVWFHFIVWLCVSIIFCDSVIFCHSIIFCDPIIVRFHL